MSPRYIFLILLLVPILIHGLGFPNTITEIPDDFISVDRVTTLSPSKFLDLYLKYGIPVVIDRGAIGMQNKPNSLLPTRRLNFPPLFLKRHIYQY
jgi:hypothetical protein